MKTLSSVGAGWIAAALVCGSAGSVAAQTALIYDAAGGCPPRERFIAALAERGASLDEPSTKQTAVHVSIASQADTFQGALQLVANDGAASGLREVHATSCAEVVEALAAVTAIELRGLHDSDAQLAAAPSSSTPPLAAGPQPAPPASNSASAKAKEPGVPRLQASSELFTAFAGHKTQAVPAGTLSFDHTLTLSLSAGAALGVLPGQPVPRFELSTLRTNFVTPPGQPTDLIEPVIRGHISFLGPGTYTTPDTETRVFGITSGIGTCWVPSYDTRGFIAALCSELGFGVLALETEDRAGKQVQSKMIGFGSVGMTFEAQYALGSLVHLTLALGIEATTQASSAERADGSQIFHAARFGNSSNFSGFGVWGHGLLGIGLHF